MGKKSKNNSTPQKVVITGEGVASLALNASYLFAGRGLTIAVRFIYAIILARYLGPELYGYLNYGMSWYFAFFPIATLSLGVLLKREIGRNRKNSEKVVNQTLALRLLASVIAAILCGVGGFFFETEPTIKRLLLLFSIALVGRSLWLWIIAVFIAHEKSDYSLRLNAVFRPLEVVFGLIVLASGGGIFAVASVHAALWWLQAMRGFYLISRHITPIRLDWTWPILFRFFVIGLPITIASILNGWLANGPLVLYRYFVQTGNSLGQLSLAMQVFILLGNLLAISFSASLPLVSRSVYREDGKDIYFADAMLRFGIIFGAAAGIAALGIGEWLVELFFGNEFHEAGILLGFTLWLLIPGICDIVIWNVYMARGQYVLPMISAALGAIIFTALFPWIVSIAGPAGAVISAGIGMSFSTLVLIVSFAKSDALNLRRILLHPFAVVFLALGLYFTLHLMNISVWILLPVCFTVFFTSIFIFGIITPSEWSALVGFIKKKLA
ncbi:MAG: oligosaccharide flippase family protein [Deltaproteobacteria bacterium]|nr:oligosaccharide flippase family protein [Deltaproteobacteria bacterium]